MNELTLKVRIAAMIGSVGLTAAYAHVSAAAEQVTLPAPIVAVPGERAAADMLRAARHFYSFWNSGDDAQLKLAISPHFVDRTLPVGRPQGPEGPAYASKHFRGAVPDLNCEVQQLILAGDRVVAHLRFRGHFTGVFGSIQGTGAPIDFTATDILRIETGRITDNWHIEDNLTLMQQLGIVPKN